MYIPGCVTPEKVPFLLFFGFCEWPTWGGYRGHPEAAHQPPRRQVEANLLSCVWLREELGLHHHGTRYPPLNTGLEVTCELYQRAEPTVGGCSRDQNLQVIGTMRN